MENDDGFKGDFNIDFDGACIAAATSFHEDKTEDGSALNISDVIDAIKIQDPQAAIEIFPLASGMAQSCATRTNADDLTLMDQSTYNDDTTVLKTTSSTFCNNRGKSLQSTTSSRRHPHISSDSRNIKSTAFVKIVEQPASKALKFRYVSEGRLAGSIPGINSTHENKTYPSIEVIGYQGRAFVVVSCVTKDKPYRPHPHNLVGRDGCKKGVCTMEINSETMKAQFNNIGIQCVKKKDIESALLERENIKVDPFRTGFAHRFQPSSIDLNAVRLCFQVFLEKESGKLPLTAIVSNPIYDKKAISDLIICKLSCCSSTVAGGSELILLCEKVAKEDISVRFFEEKNEQIIWEAYGDFQHTDVHKQTAISFKTPQYRDIHIERPITVCIQLKRPSDGATSEALPFDYLPLDSVDPEALKRKRQKINGDPRLRYEQYQERYPAQQPELINIDQKWLNYNSRKHQALAANFLGGPIKTEPRDWSPNSYPNFGSYRPSQQTPFPQPNMLSQYQEYGSIGTVNNSNRISPGNQFAGNSSPYGFVQNNTLEFSFQQQFSPFDNHSTRAQSPQVFNVTLQQSQSQQSSWNILNQSNQQQQSQEPNSMPGSFSNAAKQNNFHVENILPNDVHHQQHHSHNQHKLKSNLLNMNIIQTNVSDNNGFIPIIQQNNNDNTQTSNLQSIQLTDGGDTEPPNVSSLLDMDSEQLLIMNSAELKELQLS